MAVSSVISRVYDLTRPLIMETLSQIFSTGDNSGDKFNVALFNGAEPVDLTGASATGYFIKIPKGKSVKEGTTINILGTVSQNVATVTLPSSCYTEPCRFVLTIKVTLGEVHHAIFMAEGAISRTET